MKTKQLALIKAELERKLGVINEAIEIEAELEKEKAAGVSEALPGEEAFLGPEHVERAALSIKGDFTSADVAAAISARHRGGIYSESLIPNTLHKLVKNGQLKYVAKRQGRKPAIYCRIVH